MLKPKPNRNAHSENIDELIVTQKHGFMQVYMLKRPDNFDALDLTRLMRDDGTLRDVPENRVFLTEWRHVQDALNEVFSNGVAVDVLNFHIVV